MTDPLAKYRKNKKLDRMLIHAAYILTGVNGQPLVLCVRTDDGWIEICPVDPRLVEELEICLGEKLTKYPLQELFDFSISRQQVFEAAKALLQAELSKVPTFK